MKRHRNRNLPDKLAAEEARRYRSKLVDMLDDVCRMVGNAPPEMHMPRESIQRLLMASYYLLDVTPGFSGTEDPYFIESAIRELQRGHGTARARRGLLGEDRRMAGT